MSPSVPPTGADKGRVQSECPHRLALPFIVTNPARKRSRAGRALAVCPFAAAFDTGGWSPSAKTLASRVNRFGSWRVSLARPVGCRALRDRRERISLLLCSPGPHGPTAIDCPGNVPQSIAVRLPLRLVAFAGVRFRRHARTADGVGPAAVLAGSAFQDAFGASSARRKFRCTMNVTIRRSKSTCFTRRSRPRWWHSSHWGTSRTTSWCILPDA